MDIEFDRTPLKKPQRFSWRFIGIFIAVLLVTGGILYCIVPRGEKKTNEDKSGKGAVADTPAVTENQKDLPVPGEEKVQKEVPGAGEQELPAASDGENQGNDPEKPAKTTPVKGQPWSGDPVDDTPEKPLPAETLEKENSATAGNFASLTQSESVWVISYTVARGDNLERLAKRFHTTVQMIREMNQLKSNVIYLGAKLKIVPGPWKIVVSKPSRRLTLFNLAQKEERFFASYEIGIGRAGSTPGKDFVIAYRLYHPSYTAPNGAIFEYGAPENPLGDYFLTLATETEKGRQVSGYGIHGAPGDAGVGRSLSHGCVRMRNDEVKKLYLLCPVGTHVSITE